MLKTPDKKTAASLQTPASYKETGDPTLGIAFQRKDGSHRFAPYSFLSNVDYDGTGQLVFRFTDWRATVRGEALQPLWNAVREGCLAEVRELNESPKTGAPWVCELIFAEADLEPPLTLFS